MIALSQGLEVPVKKNRIGVIIGKHGSTKKLLEEAFKVKLEVKSDEGTVVIVPTEESTPLSAIKARDAIRAISLGFTPEQALKLSEDLYYLVTIDLREYAKNRKDMQRIKGRIIGEDGKTRRIIEEMTGAYVTVGEREVGIIGDYEQVRVAREAIEQIIAGRPHKSVYNFLRAQARTLKRRRMELWEKFEA